MAEAKELVQKRGPEEGTEDALPRFYQLSKG